MRKNCPDKPYLQERDAQNQWGGLTYAETLAAVNQLSNGLVAMGLTTDRPIAILSENCVNMALIQFAAMQVGLPITPISYAYSVRSQTGSLIRHILDVTRASMLVMSNADARMPKTNQWDTSDLQLYAFSNSKSYAKRLFRSLDRIMHERKGQRLVHCPKMGGNFNVTML